MKIVRHNTFETNSSSTHSVSLSSGRPTPADIEHSLSVLRKHKSGSEIVIDLAARRKMDDETLGCVNRVWAFRCHAPWRHNLLTEKAQGI
jgi:hypothetical protein